MLGTGGGVPQPTTGINQSSSEPWPQGQHLDSLVQHEAVPRPSSLSQSSTSPMNIPQSGPSASSLEKSPEQRNAQSSSSNSKPGAQRQRTRHTRSTRGCFTCRASKVKCDENMPTCLRCMMSSRQCRWPTADQLAHPRKNRREKRVPNSGSTRTAAKQGQPEVSLERHLSADASVSSFSDVGRDATMSVGVSETMMAVSLGGRQ